MILSLTNFNPKISKKLVSQFSLASQRSSSELLFVFQILYKSEDEKTYKWLIQRTYSQFSHLSRTMEKIYRQGIIAEPPGFPNSSVFNFANLEQKFEMLEVYLIRLLQASGVRSSAGFLEFLEVSALSFDGTSKKRKEGYVLKRTGGRINNEKLCCNLSKHFKRLQKRWVVLKDNMIGYLTNNSKDVLHEVLMFKGRFEVKAGSAETGYDDGVLIITNRRNLLFRAGDVLARDEWVKAIEEAYQQSEWKNSLVRFESSFPIRKNNHASWLVDGKDYFNEVYNSLNNARKEVFITDWWLSPEFLLIRPAETNSHTSIVEVLATIAQKGVQVYVHIYKEVSLALSLNSLHSKKTLMNSHPNIKVVRHPHRSVVGSQFLWSHHEKIICIDQEIAFLGGLDLCYGRMDDHHHTLVDETRPHTWPGIDYSNIRVADFTDVENYEADSIDRSKVPRMPWHDVGVKLQGKAASDVALHFIELWNHVMTDISSDYWKNKDLIQPQAHSFKQDLKFDTLIRYQPSESPKASQFLARFSGLSKSFSGNLRFDVSALDILEDEPGAPSSLVKLLPHESNAWITKNSLKTPTLRSTFSRTIDRENLEELDELLFKNEVEADIQQGDEFWARNLLLPKMDQMSRTGTCKCQIVRSAGPWSLGLDKAEHSIHTAYLHMIAASNHFIYIENQFFISRTAGKPVKNSISAALVERIKIAATDKQNFKVIVLMPLLPGFEGKIDSSSILKAQLHWEYSTICRGIASMIEQLKIDKNVKNVDDFISFYSLRTHALLNSVPVTEMIYVHSKLMIIDDKTVIIGSANINDRSMLGHRDSEIAVIITDKSKVDSVIDGIPVKVSEFARSLRIHLFQEFTQCQDTSVLVDPLSKQFWNMWKTVAQNNTFWFRHVFRCVPDDNVRRVDQLTEFERGSCLHEYQKLNENVKGFLVQFPLDFLQEESLKITIFNKEYLLPEENFV